MINQLFLIGIIKEIKTNNELIVEVRRNYKNMEGIFEKDTFKCNLWTALSKKISLNCKIGDIVAIKGRLVDNNSNCSIVAEQVILLNKGS